ncbi:uncharacterized protein PITG_09463 [Phytophthora infestans T30-4]|uniref:Uncharacterized protein n=1 Tax=Phytophthora infestans (strain T30-4) TaxID=403677 RepID=D0NC23_PHYIT|nr:uncharacterized protein PITG_09463 [Phytophthora infestans T30-4]EEY55537.1 conserved hypothetical protein [Phytophthora infestans T30-4]|eukprot:XP_002903113.1 conserved hypothetical protein [Phytophthora infestans T30-4]
MDIKKGRRRQQTPGNKLQSLMGSWIAPAERTEESKQRLRQQLNEVEVSAQRERDKSIVFAAHPKLHDFPWMVSPTVASKHVLKAIKKLAFKKYRSEGESLDVIVDTLQLAAKTSQWQAAALDQDPKRLWAHQNELTEYQDKGKYEQSPYVNDGAPNV